MAFNPGKSVGRVSIRAVPDTTRFRADLRRQLETIEKTTSMTVRVDKAKVDRTAMRESIRAQLADFKDVSVDSAVQITVDRVRIAKQAVRESIQEQLDSMGDISIRLHPVISEPAKESFSRQVNQIVRDNSGKTINVDVNARTVAARASLAAVSRTRFVDLVVRVRQESVAKALATLAALSGARLSFKWIDSLVDKFANLDKTLPRIVGLTSGVTSLVAALAGSVSGLVGIGAGLVSILPAFLVVPGLFLNAVGSASVLIVALKDAKEQLAELGAGFTDLGVRISERFWAQARQPIVDLVNGVMPQLRNAFEALSDGVGGFVGALANGFAKAFGGGRFEAIFANVTEGWRILATGADQFAGAITSLSEIAARYTPRLAGWFVRQANTFDAWLYSISNDGRLDQWMETAIDSMYDLWDATTGIAGTFAGIWKAAEAAGSGGLAGFADLMQQWQRTVNSADFQRGLTAVFRGANTAMDAFGDAIIGIGNLISDLSDPVERFIGSSGNFLGGLIEGIADALNGPAFAQGLDEFSAGLESALSGIVPSLQPIADTFSTVVGFVGDLAANLLPTAAGVIADLTPTIDALVGAIEVVLPDLADAVSGFSETVAPAIADFVEAATPAFQLIMENLADAITDFGPIARDLVDALSPTLVAALGTLAAAIKPLVDLSGVLFSIVTAGFDAIGGGLSFLWSNDELNRVTNNAVERGGPVGDLFKWAQETDKQLADIAAQNGETYLSGLSDYISNNSQLAAQEWTRRFTTAMGAGGQAAVLDVWSQFKVADIPQEVRDQVFANLDKLGIELGASGGGAGGGFAAGLARGITENLSLVTDAARGLKEGVGLSTSDATEWLRPRGSEVVEGFKAGAAEKTPTVGESVSGIRWKVLNSIGDASGWLEQTGKDLIGGMARGIQLKAPDVANAAADAAGKAVTAARNKLKIASPSRETAALVGVPFSQGIAVGIRSGIPGIRAAAQTAVSLDGLSMAVGELAGQGKSGKSNGNHIEITMPMLPGETPQEQRDNLVKELQWVS